MNEHSGLIELSAGGVESKRQDFDASSVVGAIAKNHPYIAAIILILGMVGIPSGSSFFSAKSGTASAIESAAEKVKLVEEQVKLVKEATDSHGNRISLIESVQVQHGKELTELTASNKTTEKTLGEIKGLLIEQSTHMQHVLRALESK